MSPWYDAWYFSRLQLCLASSTVTAANSRVLLEQVDVHAVLVAGLGTFLVYSVDDVMDRPRDEAQFPHLRSIRTGRIAWIALSVPLAALALGYLARSMNPIRMRGLLLLAAASVGLSVVSLLRPAWREAVAWPMIRACVVAAVWAAVCVGTPFVYTATAPGYRALLAWLFEWQTMFVIVALWRQGEHSRTSEAGTRLPRILTVSNRDRTLTVCVALCIMSAAMAVAGVLLRLFPPSSLSVASAPLATLGVLAMWGRAPVDLRLYNDLLALTNIGCATVVLVVYAVI